MVKHVSELLKLLQLEFRIVKLCGGDLGATSALTYDFEVYAPGQKMVRSKFCIELETYQSNRLNLKYVDKTKKRSLSYT